MYRMSYSILILQSYCARILELIGTLERFKADRFYTISNPKTNTFVDKTHQKLVTAFFNPLAVVNEANTRPSYTTLTGLCLTFLSASTVRVALVSFPLLHLTFTVIPPLTRAPWMDPEGHCAGRAGRRVIVRGEVTLATSGACRRPFCDSG